MGYNKRENITNFNLTFYEKLGKILYFSEDTYSEELTKLFYSRVKYLLTPNEILKLRSKLNKVTFELIVNKEYIFCLDFQTLKILRKLKRDRPIMQMLKDYTRKVSKVL